MFCNQNKLINVCIGLLLASFFIGNYYDEYSQHIDYETYVHNAEYGVAWKTTSNTTSSLTRNFAFSLASTHQIPLPCPDLQFYASLFTYFSLNLTDPEIHQNPPLLL